MAGRPRPPDRDPHTTPRWVKVSGIIAIVLALLVAIVLVIGGGLGGHGPERHLPGGGGSVPIPAGVTNPYGHVPPPGIPDHGAGP